MMNETTEYEYPYIKETTLRKYFNSSAAEKLVWLEQINRLNEQALTESKREIRKKLRNDEF